MIERLVDYGFTLLEIVLVLLLAGMTAMVFGNVVLRYFYNSGIDVSEELSRFFFVWLSFLGAIVAMRRGLHMGFDLVVSTVPRPVRRLLLFVANGLVVVACAILVWGTWKQSGVTATNHAPVTGLSMIWVFGVVFPSGICIGVIAVLRMIGVVRGTYDPYAVHAAAEARP